MTNDDFNIHNTRWNIINIDDAKGLEFSSVIVLSGRMSRNQKYIAYTRALDDLYVYEGILDTSEVKKMPNKSLTGSQARGVSAGEKNIDGDVSLNTASTARGRNEPQKKSTKRVRSRASLKNGDLKLSTGETKAADCG